MRIQIKHILFVSLLPLVLTPSAMAGGYFDIEKAKKFLANGEDSCVLAVASKTKDGHIVSPVYCIWDGVARKGTIHEVNSCMLGSFDLGLGKYGPIPSEAFGVNSKETLGKSCTKEMVDQILNTIPMSHFHPRLGKSAFQKWSKNYEKNVQKLELIVLYDKFSIWIKD